MNAQSDPISPQKRRAAVIFICITIVIDVLGFGIIIPVLPKLVQQLIGGDAAKGATMFGVFGWWPCGRRGRTRGRLGR